MEFAAVYHKTSEQMSYPKNDRELVINLKTGYEVRRVFLHHGDPFEAGILGGKERWNGVREEITEKKRLSHQLWWTKTVIPPYKRCKYYFELETDTETWFYLENGFLTKEQMEAEGRILQYFIVPWMNPSDICRTPEWVRDTVWYQIFPDRFFRGETGKTGKEKTKEFSRWRSGPVTNGERFGGNLAGIREKLGYLEELGISGIYLNPIMEAESVHKYDTTDYEMIDGDLGNEQEFTRLVKEAHERGIRVMVDGVFNHCGKNFFPWRDVQEHGKESKYADWFFIQDWSDLKKQSDTRDGRFYSFAFSANMPKLNTNHKEVAEYFCRLCERWIEAYDIDGIRFDVGNEVSHKFLKQIHERLKVKKPDIYLLGEIWHDASLWLSGDEYDGVMNYPLMSGIHDFFLDRNQTKEDFEYQMNRCYTMYREQSSQALFNLLDSHDTDRLRNRFSDLDVFYQQLAVLFTMPGSPCIYYGTELAMEGGHDPDCRRCMPWAELDSEENKARIEEMKKLIALRNTEPALRSMSLTFTSRYDEKRLIEYVRREENSQKAGQAEVLLNCDSSPVSVKGEGEVLFSRKYASGILEPGGILIRNIQK